MYVEVSDRLTSVTSAPMELHPKQKRAAGERCCDPVVYPDVERQQAERMAVLAKAIADPVRLQLVDVLRKHAGKVCVCELVPLFDLSQPTVSHHLKVLRDAGAVRSERRGNRVYYWISPDLNERLAGIAQTIMPGGLISLGALSKRSPTTSKARAAELPA